jgi:hypothetical protein
LNYSGPFGSLRNGGDPGYPENQMNTGGQNRPERRLAAILAADVAGYSRLVGADEEGTLNRLRAMGCFGAKRYADCIVSARTMAAKFPEDVRAFFLEASALAMRGDLTAATKARETLLCLRPPE